MDGLALLGALQRLQAAPPHHVRSPACQPKRASTALIVRIRPSCGDPARPLQRCGSLEEFFAQPWAQQGSPEILFIKRSERVGDSWSAHVALPGGKRDLDDADDRAVAMRETSEEVGLQLSRDRAICVGHLIQRLVTTSIGNVPLLVLCPYVFLLTDPSGPELELQPAEVSSAHWVPLASLVAPENWTFERADLASRLASQKSAWIVLTLRFLVGRLKYRAIRLRPTESIPGPEPKPLLLWGLTLWTIADFLGAVPLCSVHVFLLTVRYHCILKLIQVDIFSPVHSTLIWTYPTVEAPDIGTVLCIMTHRLRKEKPGNADALQLRTDWIGKSLTRHQPYLWRAIMLALVIRCILLGILCHYIWRHCTAYRV